MIDLMLFAFDRGASVGHVQGVSSSSYHLDSGARDEEPLVNASINRSWCSVLTTWDVFELRWVDTVG